MEDLGNGKEYIAKVEQTVEDAMGEVCSKDVGRDSSVRIATRYGLDGPGMESRCGDEIFPTRPDWR